MTLLQLEYFQEVVKSGSIAKAAEILGISRSALSITLERLETDLGYPLFERKNKDIVINNAPDFFQHSDKWHRQFKSAIVCTTTW